MHSPGDIETSGPTSHEVSAWRGGREGRGVEGERGGWAREGEGGRGRARGWRERRVGEAAWAGHCAPRHKRPNPCASCRSSRAAPALEVTSGPSRGHLGSISRASHAISARISAHLGGGVATPSSRASMAPYTCEHTPTRENSTPFPPRRPFLAPRHTSIPGLTGQGPPPFIRLAIAV